MTPLELQDELVDEVGRILDGYAYKSPGGNRIPINVFAQNIPMNETDDEADPIPYAIVRLSGGEDGGSRDSFNLSQVVHIHIE